MPYIIGIGSTPYANHSGRDFHEMVGDILHKLFLDAQYDPSERLQSIVVGNCAMHAWGQPNIRGQVLLRPFQQNGQLVKGCPIVNVEAGCATGILSFHTALSHVLAGQSDFSLAIGVEKLIFKDDPKMAKSFPLFAGGIDQLKPQSWLPYFHEEAKDNQLDFRPHPKRLIFLDVHALQARDSIAKGYIDHQDLAHVAAKNHTNGVDNPLAQYRFKMTSEEVLGDRQIVDPLTRSMCAPLSDGASAVMICSDAAYKNLPKSTQKRAVRILSCALQGGQMRKLNAPDVCFHAAKKSFTQAGLKPTDINLAEVHDSTAYCELKHLDSLGLCSKEQFKEWIHTGKGERSGDCPINASGGLISKGHPLGATGLGMLYELCTQLRQEAGDHQIEKSPRYGLAQNGGGLIGLDEALCGVSILERPHL